MQLQIETIKPLTWEFWQGNFPCMACNNHEAEHTAKIKHHSIVITGQICNDCKNLGEDNLSELFFMLTGKNV